MDRKSKLYDKTVKKAMDFARDEGEASGHARYNMSRLGREKDKLAAKRKETNEEVIPEAKVDQGKDDAAKINTRNQRAFGNRRGQKGGTHTGEDMETRRYNTEKGRGVKMRGKKDKTPVNYRKRDRDKAVDELLGRMRKEEVVTELNRFEKEKGTDTKTGKPIQKGGSAKKDLAFQAVMKKYSNQRMGGNEPKKVRGAKSDEGTGRITRMVAKKKEQQAKSKALDAKAKKAGYKSTQDYVNVQAVRKGGLGT